MTLLIRVELVRIFSSFDHPTLAKGVCVLCSCVQYIYLHFSTFSTFKRFTVNSKKYEYVLKFVAR